MLNAYEGFASVYDLMQYNVDYEKWSNTFKRYILEHNQNAKYGLEIGCGTGTLTVLMSKKGFVMDGIDLVEEMLSIAQQKARDEAQKINFYNQNMKEMTLKRKYDFVLGPCDAFNYIESLEALENVFESIANQLSPDGVFLFDLSSVYKLREVVGDHTFAETFDESAFIWENSFDETLNKLNFVLTLFIEEDGIYKRFEEFHEQYAYEMDEVVDRLKPYFDVLKCIDGDLFTALNETSERILFICKKKEKEV